MTIKDLIEKRAKVWDTAKNFVETHEDKNGVLSEEDTATYNKMEKEIEDLTAAIDRQTRAERREAELAKPVNSPITGKPFMGDADKVKTGRASDAYKDAMLSAMRSNFRNVSNVLQEGLSMCLMVRTSCAALLQRLLQQVSTKSTLQLPSLQQHGLRKVEHYLLVMQHLTRSILMPTSFM